MKPTFKRIRKRNLFKEEKRVLYHVGEKTYCNLTISIVFPKILAAALIDRLFKRFKYCNMTYTENGPTWIITIKSVATCLKSDTFDEKKGKTIAYSKAQMKAYHIVERIYKTMVEYYAEQQQEYENKYQTMVGYLNREINFLKGM